MQNEFQLGLDVSVRISKWMDDELILTLHEGNSSISIFRRERIRQLRDLLNSLDLGD